MAHEFIPDPDSPASGKYTYALKLVPVHPIPGELQMNQTGPCRLRAFRKASENGLHMAMEPGHVWGLPGVRALLLWYAKSPTSFERVWLDDAKADPANAGEPYHTFLASLRTAGGLAVTSCMGYGRSRTDIELPSVNLGRPLPAMHFRDMSIRPFPELVMAHLEWAARDGFDPSAAPDPRKVDLNLATLFEYMPESDI